VVVVEELPDRGGVGGLVAGGEEVEGVGPFVGWDVLDALSFGLPVAGALAVDALDEVVA
jgi:hypothetical protein